MINYQHLHIPEILSFVADKNSVNLDYSFLIDWIESFLDDEDYNEAIKLSNIAIDKISKILIIYGESVFEKYLYRFIDNITLSCINSELYRIDIERKMYRLPTTIEILKHHLGVKFDLRIAYEHRKDI